MTPEARARLVKSFAASKGFDGCGITDLSPPPHADALTQWLRRGMAGTMAYMGRQAARRLDPRRILPGTDRAVVLTRNYDQPAPASPAGAGKVAKYARGRDYHEALREPLAAVEGFLRELGDASTIARSFVDAGPVPERELAQRAGIGWIGKNTMLIDPRRGSLCFIAVVLTNLDLALDAPFETDRCGTCTRCLDACPTGAFPAPRVLDSRRCISYLTIEFKGDIPPDLGARMSGWVFGCDDCQDVCPWNEKFSRPADDPVLQHDPSMASLDLGELARLDDGTFERRFGGTALERTGAGGLRRNANALRAPPPAEG